MTTGLRAPSFKRQAPRGTSPAPTLAKPNTLRGPGWCSSPAVPCYKSGLPASRYHRIHSSAPSGRSSAACKGHLAATQLSAPGDKKRKPVPVWWAPVRRASIWHPCCTRWPCAKAASWQRHDYQQGKATNPGHERGQAIARIAITAHVRQYGMLHASSHAVSANPTLRLRCSPLQRHIK